MRTADAATVILTVAFFLFMQPGVTAERQGDIKMIFRQPRISGAVAFISGILYNEFML